MFDDYQKIDDLKNIRDQYFNASGIEREQLKTEFVTQQKRLVDQLIKEHGFMGVAKAELTQKLTDWEPFTHKSTSWFDPEWMFGIKDGFDIIIGNPPYVQLQKKGGELGKLFKSTGYMTFSGTGDIYVLFYERGLSLAKINSGILCYITSNKWMRAGYGEKLRNYFSAKNPLILIDFGGFKVFESATVDTNILVIQNSSNDNELRACHFKNDYTKDISIHKYFTENSIPLTKLASDSWYIGNHSEVKLKEKIETSGVSLKSLGVKINFGIKTGFNKAFVIDSATRKQLIKLNKINSEVVKPVLHGKNIQKYCNTWNGEYLIFIPWHFPIQDDQRVQIDLNLAEREFELKFPEMFNYLRKYKDELSARNKEEVGKRYEWYALQRSASTYYSDFKEEKIVWREITSTQSFCLGDKDYLVLAPAAFLTSKNINLKSLLAILNSKLILWYFSRLAHNLGESGLEWKKSKIETLHIPDLLAGKSAAAVKKLEVLCNEIITTKRNLPQADITPIENQINQMVYKLYGLTPEEIKLVENNEK